MVAPLVKALGALVVGAPVAALLGLTARSIKKQEDASVPVVADTSSPVRLEVFSSYRDKRSDEVLSPKSFKKGYVAYDFRVENATAKTVRGVVVEVVDDHGDVLGHVKVGDVAPHAHSIFRAKKSWGQAFEHERVGLASRPALVITWRTSAGRRRAVTRVSPVRSLGVAPGTIRERGREKPPVTSAIMA